MTASPLEILWAAPAQKDRDEIYSHIEERNPQAAISLDELFEQKAQRLRSHPYSARAGRVPGTRELVVHRHYILVYDIEQPPGAAPRIRVLRVLKTWRMWPSSNEGASDED